MTPQQITLVQESWKQVQPIADQAAEIFYGRLFMIDPSVRPLFRGNMKEQGRKLMSMIGFAVASLTRLEAIVPGLQELGRRHARYGVQDRHYAVVEPALIGTLRQGLGAAFTEEVEDAWRVAYHILSSTMKDAAKLAA